MRSNFIKKNDYFALPTFINTLRTSGAMRVEDSFLTGYDFATQQIVFRITSYSDGSSVGDGKCGVSRQVVLYYKPSTRIWKIHQHDICFDLDCN